MNSDRWSPLLERVTGVESEIDSIRRSIEGEDLPPSDRQYVSRCFDLLDMELEALRQYLGALK